MPTFTLAPMPTTSTTATAMATLLVPSTITMATLQFPFTAATATLPVSSELPNTLTTPFISKPQGSRQTSKTWPGLYTPMPLTAPVHSDWSSDEDWDSTIQEERERTNKIVRRENRKVVEEDSRKKAKERTLLSRSCAPDWLGDKPNIPLTNPPAPVLEDRKRPQEKQRDQVTNYYPPSPIYIASYKEEDAPTLVNNLIQRLTESDWDSDYSCSYQKEHYRKS